MTEAVRADAGIRTHFDLAGVDGWIARYRGRHSAGALAAPGSRPSRTASAGARARRWGLPTGADHLR